jgi:hypothetical protein
MCTHDSDRAATIEERIATSAAARDDGGVHLLARERYGAGCCWPLARRADERTALDSKFNYCFRRGLMRSVGRERKIGSNYGRIHVHPSEAKMSHASMLKARRQHQKTRKLLDVAAKQAKRLAKQALAGPVVKKEKVKKEKVKTEKVKTEKVKKVKLTKEELGRQDAKKGGAGAGKKGAS